MAIKKIPIRKCIGCNEGKPKKELVRVVKNANGEISLDVTGKKPGRGAYICPDKSCLAKAQKAKRLQRAFECQISDEVFQSMALEIEERTNSEQG